MTQLALAVFCLGLALILGAALVVAVPLFQPRPEGPAPLPPADRGQGLTLAALEAMAALEKEGR
jgi:hypothetical protein